MAVAIPAVALVSSLAATGLSVAGKIQAGDAAADAAQTQATATKAGDDYQAAQADRAAAYGRVKAQQTDAIMRTNLQSSLANIMAVRTSAGTDPSSPTGNAILARQEAIGDQERQQRVTNIMEQVGSDENAAAFYRWSGLNALAFGSAAASADETAGYLGGAGAALSGISGAFNSGFFGASGGAAPKNQGPELIGSG